MLQFQHYLPNMKVITRNDSMKRKAVQYLDSCIDTFIQKYFMISLRFYSHTNISRSIIKGKILPNNNDT